MACRQHSFAFSGGVFPNARSVAAIFADLSSRGLIALQRTDRRYTVKRLYSQRTPLPKLPHEENTVLDFLFANFYQETTFDPDRQSQGCASVVHGALLKSDVGRYTKSHAGYVGIGLLASCVAAVVLLFPVAAKGKFFNYLAATGFLGTFTIFGAILNPTLPQFLRDIRKGIWSFRRSFLMLLLLSFIATWLVISAMRLRADYSWSTINSILVMGFLNIAAQPFLRRDSEAGRKLKQQIEGFRAFLLAVEQDPLNRMNTPNEIHYGASLSYAVALEVKEPWGDCLANAFSQV